MALAQNRVRFLYYSGSLSIVVVLLAVLGGIYFFSYSSQTGEKIQQLADGIYDGKKAYVKDVVDRTIQDIDLERERETGSVHERLGYAWDALVAVLSTEATFSGLIRHITRESIVDPDMEALCLDRRTGTVATIAGGAPVYSVSASELAFRARKQGYRLSLSAENDRFLVLVGISGESVESRVKNAVTNRIRGERLVDNGYIWVNWILDYEGGDDYAIRLVHPNMTESEGSFLSTATHDIMGNTPYLEELEGVKKDGEVYYEYYIKKMDSDTIAHKLSYAKLYEPYDWIIATGVYLDDIDALVTRETAAMRRTQGQYVLRFIGIGSLAILFVFALIVIFERRFELLIKGFQDEVTAKNRELEVEKKLIEEIAYLDPLTGLLNRRAMLALIEQAFAKVRRHGGVFSVVVADIDFFKRVNDEHGHLAGDRVLTDIGALLKGRIRAVDAVSRWGGEEFLLLLEGTGAQDAVSSMDRLRESLALHEFSFEGETVRVTMSFGLAAWTAETPNATELIKLADSRLYAAKVAGRNRVIGG